VVGEEKEKFDMLLVADDDDVITSSFFSFPPSLSLSLGWKKSSFFLETQPSGFFCVFLFFFIYLPRRESF
jgi:hypothetical protein